MTPLEAADTPNLDRLASLGMTGLLQPLGRGLAPGSEVAHFVIFGYPLEQYPGRGVFETVGEGMPLSTDEVVYRGLFCAVEEQKDGSLTVVERPIDMADNFCAQLAENIGRFELGGVSCEFVFNSQKQGILYLRGDVSEDVTDADPYLEGLPIITVEPLEGTKEPKKAAKTAACLNAYLQLVYKELSNHSINAEQKAHGKLPANFLLIKWCGRKRELIPFEKLYGFKAASISSGIIYNGIATELGMDWIGVKYLPDWQDDLVNRLKLAEKAFDDGYEFVHVHTKGPDHAAHEKNPLLKRAVISELDAALGYLFDSPLLSDENLIIITGDHSTPSGTDLLHSGEAVPLLMLGRNTWPDSVREFNEKACVSGGLGRIDGKDMMPTILNLTDRIKYYSAKLQPFNGIYWPKTLNAFKVDK
jgi:2,3-bisphosphoglycerate-independent phosphoglycerate mutase